MPRLELPRFEKVKFLILRYSSPLKLNGGVQFRVCNVCSKRLPSHLDDQHLSHLKLHEKHWNLYMVLLSKHLQIEVQKPPTSYKPAIKITVDEKDNETSS